jgi:hypothetical protein
MNFEINVFAYSLVSPPWVSMRSMLFDAIRAIHCWHMSFKIYLVLSFSSGIKFVRGNFIWISYSLQLTRAYFAFLEVLFNSHIVYILNLDTSTFMHIVGSLESGLKGLDTNISSQVCAMTLCQLTYGCKHSSIIIYMSRVLGSNCFSENNLEASIFPSV